MRFRVFRGPPNAPPPAPSSGEEGGRGEQEPPMEELGEDRIEGAGAPVAAGIEGVRRPVAPVVVPRWIQLVLLPIALLALWALARAAGPVLLILLAASTTALILNPLLKMLQRRGTPRGLAILVVYLAFFAALGGLGVLLSDPL